MKPLLSKKNRYIKNPFLTVCKIQPHSNDRVNVNKKYLNYYKIGNKNIETQLPS